MALDAVEEATALIQRSHLNSIIFGWDESPLVWENSSTLYQIRSRIQRLFFTQSEMNWPKRFAILPQSIP